VLVDVRGHRLDVIDHMMGRRRFLLACGHGNLHIAQPAADGEQNQQARIEDIVYRQVEVEFRSVCSFV
jgi:hypothetical protein